MTVRASRRLRETLFAPSYVGQVVVVAVFYIVAARAGLQLDAVSGFATLVWPPTGIALAALLLGGYRLWPGIFVGALIANVWTGAPIVVAIGIATGNTLEALLGSYALKQLPGFRLSLDRVMDAVALIVLAAGLSTLVSASVGVTSLHLGGVVPRSDVMATWRSWWLGDAIGALLVAPPILVWATAAKMSRRPWRMLEAAALAASVLIASLLIFVVPVTSHTRAFDQAYVFFPLLIWAAIRFGQCGAVTTTFVVSAIAVWGTAMGNGPFVQSTLHGSLYALQTFMGMTAATFLILGASISERARAENELQSAYNLVSQANRAKAEFLAVMSHELRTPLNAIAGYAELLSLGVSGALSEKQADAVARIRTNQQHLLALIDDVLSFAKIEAGTIAITPQHVRLRNALDALEPLVRPELLQRKLSLSYDPGDPELEVVADPTKLRQILLNVLGNAIKFTPQGGRIALDVLRDGDVAKIRVADSGIGVAAENLEQIFEPFFQVDSGTTREYPGVGLGLAISRDLARAMGGDVSIESTLGKGSVVSIALPIAAS
jgi:signal transduction histidine kinase